MLYNVYFRDSGWGDATSTNYGVAHAIVSHARAHDMSFVMICDFNGSPNEVQSVFDGYDASVTVLHPGQNTCCAANASSTPEGRTSTNIDFAVVSCHFAKCL